MWRQTDRQTYRQLLQFKAHMQKSIFFGQRPNKRYFFIHCTVTVALRLDNTATHTQHKKNSF